MRCDHTPAWKQLQQHALAFRGFDLRTAFTADASRAAAFSQGAPHVFADLSKNHVDASTEALLQELAQQTGLAAHRDAMFRGEHINVSEDRAVMHWLLRQPAGSLQGEVAAPLAQVHETLNAMLAYAEQVRADEQITDVVNIGIGGSDLGPAMAARALSPFSADGPRPHFVSNVDGADLADTLKGLDLARTLFIISSKTFTTQETMTNAHSARKRVAEALGEAAVGDHFAAVSTKLDLVAQFGIKPDRVFGFWDWVGGRYSIWSAIGLALSIAIGPGQFEEFLRGGQDADRHFQDAPMHENIPVLMGLLGVWYRNVWGFGSQAVIPYDQRLGRFPAYLQQLDMESNGKSTTRDGAPVNQATAPVIWGEPGTNGQHAFFQMLHQGTDVIPIDFLVAAEPTDADPHHHALLFANCLAQSEALMRGRSLAEVEQLLKAQGLDQRAIAELAPHKVFAGNRPSSTFIYRSLTPRTLGRLVALYEHKVFVQSAIWNINAFDQWGVELGKELCNRLAPIVLDNAKSTQGLDGSTAGLIAYRRAMTAR